LLRKGRDECGRQRAFGEQITQQIRQSKRHQKRVEIFSGAKETRKYHLPNQPEDTTRQNRQADDSRRTRASSPIFDRSHRRTKNTVWGFGKEKTLTRHRQSRGHSDNQTTQSAVPAKSKLLDPVSPRPEHGEQTIWTAHMSSANDDEICFTAAHASSSNALQRWFVVRTINHIPVGQSIKAHGTLNRLDKCAASAFTPKTSVA